MLLTAITAIFSPGVGGSNAQGQAVFGEVPAEYLQPRVARPRGEVLRRFERLEWFAAHESWPEVGDLADELLVEPADGWVEVEPNRYVGIREAVHRRLAVLPLAGLAAYRARIDPLAADWLEQAVNDRDEQLLQKVVDRAFCSAAGDDALWALGEIALERGDYQAARAAWQRIHPETASRGALAYPDASIPLADVRARLALVSLREGDFDRAERQIAELAVEHPDAAGRLGGREVNYAARLPELLEQARAWPPPPTPINWPTLFGNPQRTNVAAGAAQAGPDYEQLWSVPIVPPPAAAETGIGEPPTVYPVVSDGVVVFQDAAGIHTIPLSTKMNAAMPHTLHEPPQKSVHRTATAPTIHNENLLALLASPASRGAGSPTSQLIGLDLTRDGALRFQLQPESDDATFVGPPVASRSKVIVGELTTAQGLKASVIAFDPWTEKIAWRRSLGWAFNFVDSAVPQATTMTMAEDAGVLYISSNLGMIAALRADDGEPLWLRTYERSLPQPEAAPTTSSPQQPNPPIASRFRIIAAPDDAAEITALDAATGAQLWTTPRPNPTARMLAVDGDQVLLSGERLWSLSAATGKTNEDWGGEFAGGEGQGVVAGDMVYWPTMGDILLVDRTTGRATGKTTGRPMPLPTAGGANLVICKSADGAEEYLLAAGPDRLTAYRRTTALNPAASTTNRPSTTRAD
jgi:outer membrane protein assembly factor BamB